MQDDPVRRFFLRAALVLFALVAVVGAWQGGGVTALPFAVAVVVGAILLLMRAGVIKPPRRWR